MVVRKTADPQYDARADTAQVDIDRALQRLIARRTGGDMHARVMSAAHEAATSPFNERREPTPAQADAGRYFKGRVTVHGLRIAIENPAGTMRRGIGADGKTWATRVAANYGDIADTRGADGDPVDVFVGPFPESDRVWVINQQHPGGGFDEHKVMLGFGNEDMARQAYLNSYEPGWANLQSIHPATIAQLKTWLKRGDMSKPFTPSDTDMEKIVWNNDAQPVTTTLPKIIYGLRAEDAGGLLLDSVSLPELLDDPDIEAGVLDALVVPVARMTQRMDLLKRAMNASGSSLTVTDYTIADPVRLRGTLQVAVLFALSDGQAITIWFHNPDTTPAKLTPMDDLVSWKWMLNRKDITLVVAPERGVELNPREVARRVMRLADRNSEAFKKANAKLSEKQAALAALDTEIGTLTATLADLRGKLDVAHAARAAADAEAARVAAETPTIQEIADIMSKWDRNPAMWSNALIGAKLLNAVKLGWVARPSTSQLQWMDAGVAAYRAAIDPQPAEEPQDEEEDTLVADTVASLRAGEEPITRMSGGIAQFTVFYAGDEVLLTDELRAQIEAALGEPLVEVENKGRNISLFALVPKSMAPAPVVIDPRGADSPTMNPELYASIRDNDTELAKWAGVLDRLLVPRFSAVVDALIARGWANNQAGSASKGGITLSASNRVLEDGGNIVGLTYGFSIPGDFPDDTFQLRDTLAQSPAEMAEVIDAAADALLAAHAASVAAAKEVIDPSEAGPTEGEERRDVDGNILVFKNGAWHEWVAADESGELPPVLVARPDAQFPDAAVTALEVARDVAATNEPINRAEGNIEQADLEAKTVEQIDNALETLKNDAMEAASVGEVGEAAISNASIQDALAPFGYQPGASGGAFKTYGKLSNGDASMQVSVRAIGVDGPKVAALTRSFSVVDASTGRTVGGAPAETEEYQTIAAMVAEVERIEALQLAAVEPEPVVDSSAADRAYLTSLIDGSGDLTAPDVYDRLEPLFDKYAADPEMSALVDKAADAFSARALTDAQSVL